jgi:hypothetical protein
VSDPLDFGRLIVNKTGRDTGGLGKRRSGPDEQRLYRAPVEGRLAERRRQRSDEDESHEDDFVLAEFLRRHRRDF